MNTKRLQIRRDTADNWSRINPLLLEGEIGIIMENGRAIGLKIGNGAQTWNSLNEINLEDIAHLSDIPSLDGYATQKWVGAQGYAKSSDLGTLAKKSSVGTADIANGAVTDGKLGEAVLNRFIDLEDAMGNANERIDNIDERVGNLAIPSSESITYEELKKKKDEGKLVVGAWYRIVDYKCIIYQTDINTVDSLFDVIVQADAKDSISHYARACARDGVVTERRYDQWRLLYDINNDPYRYVWADQRGRGVIYRLIDENGNDCPYDFTAIQFGTKLPYEDKRSAYYFTFHQGKSSEVSRYCANNVIKPSYFRGGTMDLKVNIMYGMAIYNNVIEPGCDGNFLAEGCSGNTLRVGSMNNVLHAYTSNNIIGAGCRYNTLHAQVSNCLISTSHKEISYSNVIITDQEPYYDDNGRTIPIKHPDLTSLPNILPYKLAGEYVYEQMIYVRKDDIKARTLLVEDSGFSRTLLLGATVYKEDENGTAIIGEATVYSHKRSILCTGLSEGFNYWVRLEWSGNPSERVDDNYYYQYE